LCVAPPLSVRIGTREIPIPQISYTKIWIWHEAQDDSNVAHNFGHIAFQVCLGENQVRYISFWVGNYSESHRQQCGAKCNSKYHFHQNKEEDDLSQPGKVATEYCLYSLQLDKIIQAFEKFAAKPEAYGSLGWGIFHRPYAFNATGLVAYLLGKGGIFRLAPYKRNTFFSRIFKIIAGVGFVSTLFNFWSAYQVKSIGQTFEHPFIKSDITFIPDSPEERINRYIQYLIGLSNTAGACELTQRNLVEIHEHAWNIFLNLEKHDIAEKIHKIRGEALEIVAEAEDANKVLNKSFEFRPGPRFFIFQSPAGAAKTISERISFVARITLIPVFLSLGFLYIQHRFLEGEITSRELAVIAQKAQRKEEREYIRIPS